MTEPEEQEDLAAFRQDLLLDHGGNACVPVVEQLGQGDIVTGDVGVEDVLIERVAAFDGDVVYGVGQRGIADESEQPVVGLLVAVGSAEPADGLVPVEGLEDGLGGVLRPCSPWPVGGCAGGCGGQHRPGCEGRRAQHPEDGSPAHLANSVIAAHAPTA